MNLKMRDLENCFKMAKIQDAVWIAIATKSIEDESSDLIISPNVNFNNKLKYYKKEYTDDLISKVYIGRKIVGFTFGNTLASIENFLFEGEEEV